MLYPHGGKLINRAAARLRLDREQVKDVKNIAHGVYSPLTGFLRQQDFESVLDNMRLADGTVWPIPIVLDVGSRDVGSRTSYILLEDEAGKAVAALENPEVYEYDKDRFASLVFGTTDREHPGVAGVYAMKDYLLGGDITLLDDTRDYFPEHNFTPEETRKIFKERGWNTVVAFQTRNIPHRGHEFLQMEALREADGLFVQPVIGEKKVGDFKDEYILASYELLIARHYPRERTFLGILPLKMRYAGPREAVFHAIIRKNFGCTHFIVGRDHAGIGKYYGPFEAQKIFERFAHQDIGVTILKYPEVVYHPKRRQHVFFDQLGEDKEEALSFSGTKLREHIQNKETPPEHILRPELFEFLAQSNNVFVDNMYKEKPNHKGFVLWFTGLSQSGKSTTADKVYEELKNRGMRVERLDGDIVRESLTRDLGFSKEDRDENLRRVAFVAKLLARNGVGVLCSFISPYRKTREEIRNSVDNFIEVYCNAPLGTCEARDTKGLYKKARAGEIQNFTGISDPYEPPKEPEIELDTHGDKPEVCANRVMNYLRKENYGA